MAYGEALRRNQHGVWSFRWVVPDPLRQAFPTLTIKRSLDTKDRREAVVRSLPYRMAVIQLAQYARQGHMVSDSDLKKVLDSARIASRRLTAADQAQDEFTEAHAQRARAQRDMERMRVGYTEALGSAVHTATLATIEATARKLGPPLSSAIRQFVKEHTTKGSWTDKTQAKYTNVYRNMIEGLGDVAVNSINRDDMVDWLAKVVRLPKNARSIPAIKELSFNELAALEGYETLSATSINDQMSRASGFFAWAMKVDGFNMARNPADGLSIPNKAPVRRRPFGLDQLRAIFGGEPWQKREFLQPHQYWLPVMGLLTGMRINEICQLRTADFKRKGQIDVISCADLSEGARAKNENATRTFPVHEDLIRLGLLDYVTALRKAKHKQLFPELVEGRDGYGTGPSKWFGRYCDAVGVTEKWFVFHSFRHLFISQRLNLQIGKHFVQAIVGHEQGDVTTSTYTEFDFGTLQKVVNAAGFSPEIVPLVPLYSTVKVVRLRRFPPSRLGARKTRAKRVLDAAARKAARK